MAEGFEPSDGGYPSHAFEACSLGRSDTPPRGSLPGARPVSEIAGSFRDRIDARQPCVADSPGDRVGKRSKGGDEDRCTRGPGDFRGDRVARSRAERRRHPPI